jgi:protein-tyrosine phosphatase
MNGEQNRSGIDCDARGQGSALDVGRQVRVQTELHFHLLPGVDDGPADDAEAVDLARLAIADKTSRIVTTPHVRFVEVEALGELTARCRAVLCQAGLELEVCAGGELSPDDVASLDQTQLELLAHGPSGGRWLLLEAPLFDGETDLDAAAEELRRRGFGVLIGHPERSPSTPRSVIRRQVARGAVLQLNASSLTGDHGPEARLAAIELARSGLPFVVASDAHSPARPPRLTSAATALAAAGVDAAAVRAAVDALPEAILVHGLSAAAVRRTEAAGLRLVERERPAPPVARSAEVFFDRGRGP